MDTILLALILVLFAGFINGSFAAPMKYMTKWDEENIWFAFSFWGFLILPWLTILIMAPEVFDIIKTLPTSLILTIVLGGIAFGIGQIAFALAFQYIGIGLAFVINISMGTAGSALIPLLWHRGILGTEYSYFQMGGIAIFVLAVLFGAAAGHARDRKHREIEHIDNAKIKKIKTGMLLLGVILAVIAGVGSVGQGVTYIWSNPTVSEMAAGQFGSPRLGASIITWVIIFSAAWIPYAIYFLSLNIKRHSFSKLASKGSLKYWFTTIFMGIGFWGSLIFFSWASNEIGGDLAPTVAWPLFMVFIILTSNFWSWKSGEWRDAGKSAITKMFVSLALFVVAIVVFSMSAGLQPKAEEGGKNHKIHYMHIKHHGYPRHHLPQQQ